MNEFQIKNIKNDQIFPTHSSLINESENTNSQDELLRPLKQNQQYKKEDLIKVHEFRRENIRESFKELEDNTDFFAFTSEDDPKYKFLDVKYMLRSKLLIKSIFWSFGIGCAFFLHRYFRKQIFSSALKWGCTTWALSMFAVWGSFELQPHLMTIFHSQFIRDLSTKDQYKFKRIGNLKQEEILSEDYFNQYGVNLKYSFNTDCEIAKLAYDYDSVTLQNFNYSPLNIDKITKKKEISEEDIFDENFDEKEIQNSLRSDDEVDIEYDFSSVNSQLNDNCVITNKKFFELEKNNFDKERLKVLKNDVLSKKHLSNVDTEDILRKEVLNAENYLNGVYKNFDDDPDYLKF